MQACSFTGHRTIGYTHRSRIAGCIYRAVLDAYGRGCRTFYDGGALGFDLLCAEIVEKMKKELPDIRLVMLLPCLNQDVKWSFEDRIRYERIVNSADEVICLSPTYYNGCMHARNRELVKRADMMIAYLGRDTGGTAQTVRMAQRAGLDVVNLYDELSY